MGGNRDRGYGLGHTHGVEVWFMDTYFIDMCICVHMWITLQVWDQKYNNQTTKTCQVLRVEGIDKSKLILVIGLILTHCMPETLLRISL